MDLGYRPLVYMWIAEYGDGTALPQFDPETGRENKFSDVDQSRLCRFGWYPFSIEFAAKVPVLAVPTANPPHVIELKKSDNLVAARRNRVEIRLGGGIHRGETFYLLGVEGKEVKRIGEDGRVR